MQKYYILKQKKIMKCGLFLKIIKKDFNTGLYQGEWEDGTIQNDIIAASFMENDISHPELKPFHRCSYMGFNCIKSKTIKQKVLYRCECTICKDEEGYPKRFIFTPQQMIEHFKELHKGDSLNGKK